MRSDARVESHPTASVSPSPTTTLASAPAPALPLTRAQLFTVDAVQSHVHDTVSTKIDETRVGEYVDDLAVLQAGGTECAWGGQEMAFPLVTALPPLWTLIAIRRRSMSQAPTVRCLDVVIIASPR